MHVCVWIWRTQDTYFKWFINEELQYLVTYWTKKFSSSLSLALILAYNSTMAASGKPRCHYKLHLSSLCEVKTKTGEEFLFHGPKLKHQFSTFLNSLSSAARDKLWIGHEEEQERKPKFRHNDKQILSVVDVILDIVRDAEMISVISTSPFSLSLLSQSDDFTLTFKMKKYIP